MWSRVIILALGLWLGISVFVFHDTSESWPRLDLGCSVAVVLLAGASLMWRTRTFDPAIVLIGCLLIGAAYADFGDPPPAAQNRAVTGLMLMLFALIPAPERQSSFPSSTAPLPQTTRGVDGQQSGSRRGLTSGGGRLLIPTSRRCVRSYRPRNGTDSRL
jgi:hypothetical protein